jgi:hypothetical protein
LAKEGCGMGQKSDEFQRLVECYKRNYERLRRLTSLKKARPNHMSPHKLERKIASKQRLLKELEDQIRKILEKMKRQ